MSDLDWEPGRFRDALYRAADWIVSFYGDLRSQRVFHGADPVAVRRLIDGDVPRRPASPDAIMERFQREIAPAQSLIISPNFLAYILSGGNQAAIVASLLATGLNAGGGKWRVSAAHAELGRVVIRWICEFIGLAPEMGGILTSGGSMANLLGLHVARVARSALDIRKRGSSGSPPLTVYMSCEGHSSLQKCVEMLGIGNDRLRRVAVRDDFTMDVEELVRIIAADVKAGYHPICVVGTAGTTNTGAIDPLVEIASVCRHYNLWFHVDGAYGAPAAATPSAAKLFAGLELADSVAVDPHKWLYVPFEAGCLLVRSYEHLHRTFSLIPSYLADGTAGHERWDWHEYGFQLSQDLKALKVWMTFLAYGADELASAIDDNIRTMRYMAQLIDESSDFERLAPVPLSIVCFRYLGSCRQRCCDESYLDRLNDELLARTERDGRAFLAATEIHGKRALRVCCVNHRTRRRDVESLLELLRTLGLESSRKLHA